MGIMGKTEWKYRPVDDFFKTVCLNCNSDRVDIYTDECGICGVEKTYHCNNCEAEYGHLSEYKPGKNNIIKGV